MAANILFVHLGCQKQDGVDRERADHLGQLREEKVKRWYRLSKKKKKRFICNLFIDKLQQATNRLQALSVELQEN